MPSTQSPEVATILSRLTPAQKRELAAALAPAQEMDDVECDDDGFHISFANPGSALRSASRSNPRNLPCPTCDEPDCLTPEDARQGYQCDCCADRAEGRGGYE